MQKTKYILSTGNFLHSPTRCAWVSRGCQMLQPELALSQFILLTRKDKRTQGQDCCKPSALTHLLLPLHCFAFRSVRMGCKWWVVFGQHIKRITSDFACSTSVAPWCNGMSWKTSHAGQDDVAQPILTWDCVSSIPAAVSHDLSAARSK